MISIILKKDLDMHKIIHDLKNKLCIISGQTFRLSKKYGEEEVAVIDDAVDKISELLEQLSQKVDAEQK
jgi:hypothetical protein